MSAHPWAELLDAAIELELAIGQLYLRYHERWPEDAAFWWQLFVEEKNHAALLRSLDQVATVTREIPEGLLPARVEDLQQLTARIRQWHAEAVPGALTRAEAFARALEAEGSAGEAHFQSFMTATAEGPMKRIFQTLNRDDLDHARRLQEYMAQQGLA